MKSRHISYYTYIVAFVITLLCFCDYFLIGIEAATGIPAKMPSGSWSKNAKNGVWFIQAKTQLGNGTWHTTSCRVPGAYCDYYTMSGYIRPFWCYNHPSGVQNVAASNHYITTGGQYAEFANDVEFIFQAECKNKNGKYQRCEIILDDMGPISLATIDGKLVQI